MFSPAQTIRHTPMIAFSVFIAAHHLCAQRPQPSRARVLTPAELVNVDRDLHTRAARDGQAVFTSAQGSIVAATRNAVTRSNALASLMNFGDANPDPTSAPWEMFVNALTQKLQATPGAHLDGLQVAGAPRAADWNDPKFGNYNLWRTLCDAEPLWGPTYSRSTRRVTEGYRLFLDNLAVPQPDPTNQRRANSARETFGRVVDDLTRAESEVGQHWQTFDQHQQALPPERRIHFDSWYATSDGRTIGTKADAVRTAGQEYAHWLNLAGGGFQLAADAVIAFSNDAYRQAASAPDGTTLRYPTCNASPGLDAFIEQGKANASAGVFNDLAFDFDRNSGRTHTETTAWSARASWFGFFGGGGGGGSELLETNSQTFHMTFRAARFGVFTVTPGDWFSGVVVQAFQNGPWVANGPVATGSAKLWGPDGVLALMPSEIIVAFRPRVTVTVSSSEYTSYKTAIQAGGGFSIGPFGFGASYKKNTADIHFNDETNTIMAEDNSDTPQVIAVMSSMLPRFR